MSWESFGVVRFNLGSLVQGQTRIAKLKSSYNSHIIGPRFGMVNQLIGNHGLGIFGCGRIRPWGSLQGQMRIAKLKVLITSLLLVLEVW